MMDAKAYATKRLRDAARAALNALEDEERSVQEEHKEMIEELSEALTYFEYHGPNVEDA